MLWKNTAVCIICIFLKRSGLKDQPTTLIAMQISYPIKILRYLWVCDNLRFVVWKKNIACPKFSDFKCVIVARPSYKMSSEDAGENRQQRERLQKSRKLGLCQKLSTQYRACYLDGQTPYER